MTTSTAQSASAAVPAMDEPPSRLEMSDLGMLVTLVLATDPAEGDFLSAELTERVAANLEKIEEHHIPGANTEQFETKLQASIVYHTFNELNPLGTSILTGAFNSKKIIESLRKIFTGTSSPASRPETDPNAQPREIIPAGSVSLIL